MEKQMKSAATLRVIGDDFVPEEIIRLLGCAPTLAETKEQVRRSEKSGREWTMRTGGMAP